MQNITYTVNVIFAWKKYLKELWLVNKIKNVIKYLPDGSDIVCCLWNKHKIEQWKHKIFNNFKNI